MLYFSVLVQKKNPMREGKKNIELILRKGNEGQIQTTLDKSLEKVMRATK